MAKIQVWKRGAKKMKAEPLALQPLTSLERKRGKSEVGIGASKGLVGWRAGGEASSRESGKRDTGHQRL